MARYIVDGYVFDIETGQKYLYISCVLVAVAACGTAIRFYLITLLGERLVSDLRQALFDQIINLSPSFFEKTLTGDLVSRINADTTLVQSVAGSTLSLAVRNSLLLLGGSYFNVFYIDKVGVIFSSYYTHNNFSITLLWKIFKKTNPSNTR